MFKIPSIKIFATDFKNRDKWNLPFIRVGTTSDCNSIIHDSVGINNISNYQMPFSEINTIWYISRHLNDFGNSDYIGFCHYRRFFTISTNYTILPIQSEEVREEQLLTPEQQLNIILNNDLEGISPFPLLEHFRQDKNNKNYLKQFNDIIEDSYIQGCDDNTGLTYEDYQDAFNNLILFSNEELKPYLKMAMMERAVHFGTIFTLKKNLFNIYSSIIWPAIFKTFKKFNEQHLLNMNWRVGGYLLERLTSCILHAFKLKGHKIINLPIVVSNFNDTAEYRKYRTKEKLKPKFEQFKKQICEEIYGL